MSGRELQPLEVLRDLEQKRLTTIAAGQLLGLERRQVFRLLKAYRIAGASALYLETTRLPQQPAQARGAAASGADDHPPVVLGFWPDPGGRQQMSDSFGRYISAIYADRFDSYNGQKLEVTGEQATALGVIVKREIIKANGEPVEIDYMMQSGSHGWLISDIYLDGTISEVATRRAEFARILRKDGVDGLIAALNRKPDTLTGTTPRAL